MLPEVTRRVTPGPKNTSEKPNINGEKGLGTERKTVVIKLVHYLLEDGKN